MNEEPRSKLSLFATTALLVVSTIILTVRGDAASAANAIELSPQHLDAVNRRRRVVVNFDTIHGDPKFANIAPEDLVKLSLTFADDEGSHIDSIWWNWGEGHQAPYPSKLLPLYDHPGYRKWVADGVDIVRVFVDATRQRGLEVFATCRVNGGDNDLGPVGWETPRFFQNTNMFAQLPARLDNDGKADTHLKLLVGDDLVADAARIQDITLRRILHDDAAGEPIEILNSSTKPAPPDEDRIERALISLFKNINQLYNGPPRNGIEKRLEVRINNLLLGEPDIEAGWLVYRGLDPDVFATGTNLVGVRIRGRPPAVHAAMTVEKLELDVDYR